MRPLVRAMVAVAILFSPALATRPADAEMLLGARLNGGLEAALARFPGAAAIVVRDRATGYRYAKSDDRIFYAASLYKLGVMVEAYRQAAAGSSPSTGRRSRSRTRTPVQTGGTRRSVRR